jgi:hypothetical protein
MCMHRKKNVNVCSPLQSFPLELLHMILKYSTNDFRGIIRFSAVCQQWKNVGDYTTLWLKCPLYFYSSRLYFETEIHYGSDLIEAGDRFPVKIRLDDPLPLVIPTQKFKVEVSRSRSPTACLKPDAQISGLKPLQEAKRIRTDFMKVFVEFHLVWNWYGRWKPFLKRVADRVYSFRGCYEPFAFIAGIALTSLSVYLLRDLPKYNEGELSLANHFGFGCLYVVVSLYIAFFLLEALRCLYFRVVYHSSVSVTLMKPISQELGVISNLLGILTSLALFHIKLSSAGNNQSFLFSFIPLPLWSFCLLTFALEIFLFLDYYKLKPIRAFSEIFALFSLPLSFSLLALYYDSSTTQFGMTSPWLAAVFLLPKEYYVFLLTIDSFSQSINLWDEYWTGCTYKKYHSERITPRRCFANFFRTASALLMIFLVVYFNVDFAGQTINLAGGVIAWVLFLLSLQCNLYCVKYGV